MNYKVKLQNKMIIYDILGLLVSVAILEHHRLIFLKYWVYRNCKENNNNMYLWINLGRPYDYQMNLGEG